jgi:hypothetical protein
MIEKPALFGGTLYSSQLGAENYFDPINIVKSAKCLHLAAITILQPIWYGP